MELILALAIGSLTGSGVWLLLRPRTYQVIIGLSLISYGVNLFIFSMGRLRVGAAPLLGSSAGSRGQTLVETGHGIVAQAVILNKPPYDSRPRLSSLDVPRSAFTFTAPKQMPQSPMQMRSK